MGKRKGLMSIGLAIVMLLFSLIATIILTTVGRNLIKTSVDMGKGQEEAYTRVVIQSMANALDKHSGSFGDLELEVRNGSLPDFTFIVSGDLNANDGGELSIGFDTTADLIATPTVDGNTKYVFEAYTKADFSTYGLDPVEEGIILHY